MRRARCRGEPGGGSLLRRSPGIVERGIVVEAADKEVLTLRAAHDELLKVGEEGHLAEVHRIHGVEEACEAVLGGVHEVVVQREEQDRLEDLHERVARADGHRLHDSTSTTVQGKEGGGR